MTKNISKLLRLSSIVLLGSTCLTGCLKSDTMDGISIVTTKYPIEYAIDMIYGDYSNISSIYPNGVNLNEYKLTDKKINEYSKNGMLIYDGLSSEGDLAIKFLNNNKDIKLIDVSKGLCIKSSEDKNCTIYSEDELWLNPGNYLMVVQNIKNDLESFINSTVMLKDIKTKYDALKLVISTFDAQLKNIVDNANEKTIIVSNASFDFLESKYGFKVLSLDESSSSYTSADYNNALNLVKNKKVSYVFLLEGDAITDKITTLQNNGAEVVTINSLSNLSDIEREDNVDYKTIMEDFLEKLKQEVY